MLADGAFWNQPKAKDDYDTPMGNLSEVTASDYISFVRGRGFPG